MDIPGYFNLNRPDVIYETVDGETVIVNLENGVYYSLANSGVDIWNLIETGVNFEELITEITRRYEGNLADIQKAIRELLINLQHEGLVQVTLTRRSRDEESQALMPAKKEKRKFQDPVLEKYSDMQELLLLDPIHEVDEEGWPHKKEDGNHGSTGQE